MSIKIERQGIHFWCEQAPVEIVRKYLSDVKIIFEFGSYDGGDAIRYKETYPNARVISFEGCPVRHSIIDSYKDQFELECYHYAVSNIDGTIAFNQMQDPNEFSPNNPDKFGGSGSICSHTEQYKNEFKHLVILNEPVIVNSTRIDTFCKNNNIDSIDLMHIDVEGAEHLVINGFGEMRPKIVWAETHLDKKFYGETAYAPGEVDSLLSSMGYTFVYTDGYDRLYVHDIFQYPLSALQDL
jgi:FkbM family methyltransferase